MASRERRLDRAATWIGRDLSELGRDLRTARLMRGLTIRAVADAVGASPSTVLRVEQGRAPGARFETLARHAAAVGMRVRVRAYPEGAPIRDAAQIALIRDFAARLPHLRLDLEVPISTDPRDARAFDAVARVGGVPCAIEFMTRLHDCQAQLRGVIKKQSDAGVPRLIVIVRDTHANRRAVASAADILAMSLPLGTRRVLAALALDRDPGANGLAFLDRTAAP